jgi:beta-ribofuranosylaminobenzene 5'-phosphate synthase
LYESVYGVLSAIYENDFDVFCRAVKTIQGTKWKKEERDLYGKAIYRIEKKIYNSGAKCIGMSSLGPGLYFLSEEIEKVYSMLTKDEYYFLASEFNNKPRIIEYE